MNDSFPGEEQGTGWNVGSAADNSTCVPGGVGDNYGCYKSCRALKKCGRCNWSTCYNDVLFVKNMIDAVAREFCIDLDRVYVQGESNGAMMVQHLVRALPETFAGIATWFGTPMLGYILGKSLQLVDDGPLFSERTAILALHGRNDTTIPPGGGASDGGWLFEPLEQATGVWAALHRCKRPATPVATRWDGGPLNFRCHEYNRCATGRKIMQCMYDGQHGDWPSGNDGDEITLWFLLPFSRGSPVMKVPDAVELI
jgi:poly(3-hydroxybutyrate) depolymerase